MRTRRGVSLMEAAASLAVLGLTVLLAGALLSGGRGGASRIAAARTALHAASSALEAVRSGAVPLSPGVVSLPTLPGGVTVTLEVQPAGTPGLHRVRAVARVAGGGRAGVTSLATLVWRKP